MRSAGHPVPGQLAIPVVPQHVCWMQSEPDRSVVLRGRAGLAPIQLLRHWLIGKKGHAVSRCCTRRGRHWDRQLRAIQRAMARRPSARSAGAGRCPRTWRGSPGCRRARRTRARRPSRAPRAAWARNFGRRRNSGRPALGQYLQERDVLAVHHDFAVDGRRRVALFQHRRFPEDQPRPAALPEHALERGAIGREVDDHVPQQTRRQPPAGKTSARQCAYAAGVADPLRISTGWVVESMRAADAVPGSHDCAALRGHRSFVVLAAGHFRCTQTGTRGGRGRRAGLRPGGRREFVIPPPDQDRHWARPVCRRLSLRPMTAAITGSMRPRLFFFTG